MQVIEITSLTGHSPYDITICDITKSYCYVVASGVTSAPITVEIPTELSGTQELIVVITDSSGCETFSNYNCFTPTPTPTFTPTPTITPTNISCNCITFTNTGTTIGEFSYIDCDNLEINFEINFGTTLYVCGKSPSIIVGDVIYSMGLPCVNNTCIPPTPTPTLTPSSTPVIVDCVSYVTTGGTDIFKYNLDTNVLTHLTFPSLPLIYDIAINSNKFWITNINNPNRITEYYINPTPFVAIYNRTLYPSTRLNGLCAKDDNTLISTISGVSIGDSNIIVEVDISGSLPIITNKFSLPGTGRGLAGDLFYFPTTNKLFVANAGGGNTYLTQYNYTTGTLEYDVILNPSISGVNGLSSKNDKLCIFENSTGKVYRLDDITIPTFTLLQTTISGVGAAASDVSCAIIPTPTPTPTPTHTISCVTPVLSSVTQLSGSTYGLIFSNSYGCTSVDIEYSRDTITWTADTGTCSTSRIVDTGDGSGTWYFRVIQLCAGNYLTGNTLTYIPTSPNPTPTPTPTPTYPYNNLNYTYIVPEPQDATSLTDLGTYMANSGSTNFLGWGNGGVPSTTDYSNNLNVYIHYSGFTGGSGNFISNVGNLKSPSRQLSNEPPSPLSFSTYSNVTDMFGCETVPFFNTIEINITNINPNIQYFYTIWVPINKPLSPSITNILVNIGNAPCDSNILFGGIPDSVLFSQDVFVTSGAAIPEGYYRILWIDPSCLLPSSVLSSLNSSIYFRGNAII
jgi:hypothetical protein